MDVSKKITFSYRSFMATLNSAIDSIASELSLQLARLARPSHFVTCRSGSKSVNDLRSSGTSGKALLLRLNLTPPT